MDLLRNIKQTLYYLTIITIVYVSISLPLSSDTINNDSQIKNIDNLIIDFENNYKKNPKFTLLISDSIIDLAKSKNYHKGIAEGYNLKGKSYDFLRQYDSSLKYYNLALNMFDKIKYKKGIAKINNNIGIIYFKNKEYKQSEKYFLKTLKLREELGEEEDIIKSLNNIALLYLRVDRYDKALKYNLRLLDKYEGNEPKQALVLNRIGTIHYYMRSYKDAIEKFNNALELFKDIDDKNSIAQTYTSLGNVYYDIDEFNKALEYYEKALVISEKIKSKGISILLNNIGLIHKKNGNYLKALDYIKRSIQTKETSDNPYNLFHQYTSIAEIYINLSNPKDALVYLNFAEKEAVKLNELKNYEQLYSLKYRAYQQLEDYQSALKNYIKYSEVTDTLMNRELQETTKDIKIKYDSEKKAEENKRLKHINRLQTTYFSVISVLVLIIVVTLYSRIKAKQKANNLLEGKNKKIEKQHKQLEETYRELQKKETNLVEANATKDKFFSIIAHDLKNPIHAITLSSETLLHNYRKMTGEDLINLITNIYKSGNHLSNLLENLLHWARSQQGRLEYSPIKTRINDLIENTHRFLDVSLKKKEIEFTNTVPSSLWLEIDPNMMQTVFRNLVSNAIKFTKKHGRIEISCNDIGDYYEFSVRDNGIGISDEDKNKLFRIDVHHTTHGTNNEIGTGLGLILCKEFTEKHGGSIKVESIRGSGSNFIFTIPKNQ